MIFTFVHTRYIGDESQLNNFCLTVHCTHRMHFNSHRDHKHHLAYFMADTRKIRSQPSAAPDQCDKKMLI